VDIPKRKLRTCHLFAGAGGGILADLLLGHQPVVAVEIEEYPRKVLLQRQIDGILPRFPIWDDVRTFDGKPWRGLVDIVAGGFPCQDISGAGKGAGINGERSGLWKEMGRIVREIRPRFVFVENSPMLTGRGIGTVLGDLAEMGYDARWAVLSSADAGHGNLRERIWILADNLRFRDQGYFEGVRFGEARQRGASCASAVLSSDPKQPGDCWPKPLLCGVDARMAGSVDRIKAIGNGQNADVAALAWRILTQ